MQGSNLRHTAYEAATLPTELIYLAFPTIILVQIAAAAQVSSVYAIAKTGNRVFNAQIVISGPTTISATIKIAKNIPFNILLYFFHCFLN
jgi:hypothetical protein